MIFKQLSVISPPSFRQGKNLQIVALNEQFTKRSTTNPRIRDNLRNIFNHKDEKNEEAEVQRGDSRLGGNPKLARGASAGGGGGWRRKY